MTETQGMLEAITDLMRQEAREEAREEARQEAAMTQVRTIEGFLRQDVPWSTIAAATGIDEAAFGRLKQQLGATANGPAAGGAGHTN